MRTYQSILGNEMSAYIEILREAGKYTAHVECTLSEIDRQLLTLYREQKNLTEEDILAWDKSLSCMPATRHKKYSALKGFAVYLNASGIPCTIPAMPKKTATEYTPYIYSSAEWNRIIQVSDNLRDVLRRPGSNMPVAFPVLIRLLYACGLRLGEALSLHVGDIDFHAGTLTVKKAKRKKQRLVPMQPSMTNLLYAYCSRLGIINTDESYIFAGSDGLPYSDSWAERWFLVVLQRVGITYHRKNRHDRGPCLHCMRHTFVFQSLTGSDTPEDSFSELVPILSTYLGHENILETDRYLRFSYELFGKAQDCISRYTEDIFPEVISWQR
ncbi:MAG: tyrosine-type recombinase/integrase [Clostridia bacterium]